MAPLWGHVVVLSPHCDDAVISVGAALVAHIRSGGSAAAVTVFAGDPGAREPAGVWDRASGFTQAGEAARTRRAEDRAACAVLGLEAVHLDEVDEQYERRRSDEELWAAIAPHLAGADELLLPGHPLRHADHRLVTRLVLDRLDPDRSVRLYREEPYSSWSRHRAVGQERWPDDLRWVPLLAGRRDATRKLRAVACYRTQLAQLAQPFGGRPFPTRSGRFLVQLWRSARRVGEALTDPIDVGGLRDQGART